jgi:chromosome segregation ATPase
VEDSRRARREAIRQLNELRARLDTAEDALVDALATMKRTETAFDAANDRFVEAEHALDAARAERAKAREERYAARQAYERASITLARLQRRVGEMSERLDKMSPLPTRR